MDIKTTVYTGMQGRGFRVAVGEHVPSSNCTVAVYPSTAAAYAMENNPAIRAAILRIDSTVTTPSEPKALGTLKAPIKRASGQRTVSSAARVPGIPVASIERAKAIAKARGWTVEFEQDDDCSEAVFYDARGKAIHFASSDHELDQLEEPHGKA